MCVIDHVPIGLAEELTAVSSVFVPLGSGLPAPSASYVRMVRKNRLVDGSNRHVGSVVCFGPAMPVERSISTGYPKKWLSESAASRVPDVSYTATALFTASNT